jgi:CheY-like chemotaxis protein
MQKILIVDDEPVNLIVLAAMLEDIGAVVEKASDGAEALWSLENNSYDLLLLDIHMPVMDGIQVAARLRAGRGRNHGIPVVAVTGDTSRSLAEYQALGFDGLVEKPISRMTISNSLTVVHRPLPGGEQT